MLRRGIATVAGQIGRCTEFEAVSRAGAGLEKGISAMKRFGPLALVLAAALLAVPPGAQAQESSARKAGEKSEAQKKSSKKAKAKRSFKRDEPAAAEDRGAPPITENTLTVTPNVPGSGEDEPVMRGGGERPNTD